MGGNLNIINQSGEPHKKGETNFEIPVGRTKGGDTIFDANLLGGSNGNIYLFWEYYEENRNQFSHILIIVSLAKWAP